ncbi:HipA domain-containing protein [Thalassomonas haliotis]|uniref:HipA domain-containing protein n=1 Tax=Thalassomonas haliotis TaxID=485448 RepID=A0ABY7VFV5_9GAMM|nr:HipA domain-containing protein [Thalassomonas haliotis]WDE12572.1 HipA domain-containing protein [Thalassomonas haliotis]
MRRLNIFINELQVGTLYEENDIWAFQYDELWLEDRNNYPICPQIPLQKEKQIDGSTKRYIQWFFDNLLPEEGARTLLAQDLKTDEADSFGILAMTGSESAGAITLTGEETGIIGGSVLALSSEELNSRIEELPDIPLNNKESKRMSIAGAQHKMLIIKDGDTFLEPVGSMPSSHILKPEHSKPEKYWQTVRNEWFVMNLAREVGLDVPPTEVCYFPAPVYIIERFDRDGKYPEQSRLHALDGCQLLGLSRVVKYSQSSAEQLNHFSEKMRGKGAAKIAILNWAIFNAIVGNTDAHLKNLSCLVTSDGFILSPLYDLISTSIYEEVGRHLDAELSQVMGSAKLLGELTRNDVLLFGEELGISKRITQRQLDKMLSNIEVKADEIIEYVKKIQDIPGRAGELRMLREIRYKMIGEMVLRLKT